MDRYAWLDSESLVARGDFLGFLSVLALLRESVAVSDFSGTARHVKEVYTMLPSVAALDWVLPDIDLLLQCMEDMRRGFRWFPSAVVVDWNLFRERLLNVSCGDDGATWVASAFAESSGVGPNGATQRPVPLLDQVVPLWAYVRRPEPRAGAAKSPPSKMRNRGLGGSKGSPIG